MNSPLSRLLFHTQAPFLVPDNLHLVEWVGYLYGYKAYIPADIGHTRSPYFDVHQTIVLKPCVTT
jgi:hypothetical protein